MASVKILRKLAVKAKVRQNSIARFDPEKYFFHNFLLYPRGNAIF